MTAPIVHAACALILSACAQCDDPAYQRATLHLIPERQIGGNLFAWTAEIREMAKKTTDLCAAANYLEWADYYERSATNQLAEEAKSYRADLIEKKLRDEHK